MDNALAIAEQLLRRYGHVYEANQVAIVGRLFARDPAAACRALNHADWWDDRRSVASVDLALTGGFTGAARADAQALVDMTAPLPLPEAPPASTWDGHLDVGRPKRRRWRNDGGHGLCHDFRYRRPAGHGADRLQRHRGPDRHLSCRQIRESNGYVEMGRRKAPLPFKGIRFGYVTGKSVMQ